MSIKHLITYYLSQKKKKNHLLCGKFFKSLLTFSLDDISLWLILFIYFL